MSEVDGGAVLDGGALELVLARAVVALVEKVTTGSVEKSAAGPCAGDACDGREIWWRGKKTGCCVLVRRRCRPQSEGMMEKCSGKRSAVESTVVEAVS